MSGPHWGRVGGHNDDTRFEAIRDLYRDALHTEFRRGCLRGYEGKMFRPRADGPQAGYIPMSFSRSLLDLAGGLIGLEANWEPES